MERFVSLRKEVSPAATIVLPILQSFSCQNGGRRSQALAITHISHQSNLEPVIGVSLIVIKSLRTLHKIRPIFPVSDKEIEKSVVIVVSPGGTTAPTHDQISHTCTLRYIVEGPIVIIPIKMIWSLTLWIASGINHIEVKIAIIIKVSPHGRATVGHCPEASLVRNIRKRPVPDIFVKRWLESAIVCSSCDKEIVLAVIIFLVGLVSEQISTLRAEGPR